MYTNETGPADVGHQQGPRVECSGPQAKESTSVEQGPNPNRDLEQLGKEILARIVKGDQAKQRSEDLYLSAGRMLLDAKKLAPNFAAFLRDHCRGLGRSRAYELLRVAKGQTTTEEVRAKTNERKKKYRANTKATVRSGTDTQNSQPKKQSTSQAALAEFKVACNIWFAKMDATDSRLALAYATEKATAVHTKLAA